MHQGYSDYNGSRPLSPLRVSQLIVVVEGFVAYVWPYMRRRAACTRLMRIIRISAHRLRRAFRRLLSPSRRSSLMSALI